MGEEGKMARKRMLMAEQWEGFAKSVLPPGVSDVQRREMRRAFYGGAQAILFRVIESFAPDSDPTDADVEIMQNVYEELQEFLKDVKAGRA